MNILHVSAECYPVAKAGGLGDVVGSLPKFLNELGHEARVIMPMYRTKFLYTHEWEVVHKGESVFGYRNFNYTVIKEKFNTLGFDLYVLDIHGLLDRENVYGYADDVERFVAFQIGVVDWMHSWEFPPELVHVHDHHTGLIPFMMQHCYAFKRLETIPCVLTIHNAQYQGAFGWDKVHYLPQWDSWKHGLLEWNGSINPLASAIKCSWRVTTVSTTYLEEIKFMSNGLERLFEYEKGKCLGILNGIDHDVWNPETDKYISNHYTHKNVSSGKSKSKALLCEQFNLNTQKPLFVFIGRLVGEKGAELLPGVILDSFEYLERKMNFLVLGSGEADVELSLSKLHPLSKSDFAVYIGYNEQLSHLMYAGADFLLMPSRVEPCGLNQLYAMRYGTIPLVRKTGGLNDTVKDIDENEGYGIQFSNASIGDVTHAIYRSLSLYSEKTHFDSLRKKIMQLDFSWHQSAKQYSELYQSFR
jgi:starch synthase